jgi:uncharacterized membrane protein
MLAIATFAVGSMVSSYASASGDATPRSFPLVISDDVSQNALSGFIGAFIFSVVALIALKSGFYEKVGHFALFCATIFVFGTVILLFIRWVDCIARLGRLGSTIDKVEAATTSAFKKRKCSPRQGGLADPQTDENDKAICAGYVGYVQRVDVTKLQEIAEEEDLHIDVMALPGAFLGPKRPLLRVSEGSPNSSKLDEEKLIEAFEIGDRRTFDEDPRFGLIVLAEIAGRALSPAVNDPGTAIDIIGTFLRLFALWGTPVTEEDKKETRYDRVHMPEISISDMFEDAFPVIARDGARTVEVALRLQKALCALADLDDPAIKKAAKHHAHLALARAEHTLKLPEDIDAVKAAAKLC